MSKLIMAIVFFAAFTSSMAITVGIYGNPPWVYGKNGEIHGIFVDFLNYLNDKKHLNLQFVYDSEGKVFEDLEKKKIDLTFAPVDMEVEGLPRLNQPIVKDWALLYRHSSDARMVLSLKDLNDKTIAVQDAFYLPYLKKRLKELNVNCNILSVQDLNQAFQHLKSGKADYVLADKLLVDLYLSKYSVLIKKTVFQFPPIEIGLLFRKGMSPESIKILDDDFSYLKNKLGSYYKSFAQGQPYEKVDFTPNWIKYLILTGIVVFSVLVFSVLYLRFKLNVRTKQIEDKKREISIETSRLERRYKEIEDINTELRKSYESLEKKMNILERLYSVLSKISEKDSIDIEEVSYDILKIAVDSIKEADFGSISIVQNGKWRFLATVGHNKSILNSFNLPSKYFMMPKTVTLFKNIKENDLRIMPKELYEKFSQAIIPIKETILAPVKIERAVYGDLAVDIAKNSDSSFSKDSYKIIEHIASIASTFLTFDSYTKMQREFQRELVLVTVRTMESFDPYTAGHSEFVAQYSSMLAKLMGFDDEIQERIYWGALLHDIGKLGVPKIILNKPGPLTDEEFSMVKDHTVLGYTVLKASERLKDLAFMVRNHHERYDGKGYPDGLKGEEIPIECRIIILIDAWEAMTADRVYRKALSFNDALKEVKTNSGTQFDPYVVKYFFKMLHKDE